MCGLQIKFTCCGENRVLMVLVNCDQMRLPGSLIFYWFTICLMIPHNIMTHRNFAFQQETLNMRELDSIRMQFHGDLRVNTVCKTNCFLCSSWCQNNNAKCFDSPWVENRLARENSIYLKSHQTTTHKGDSWESRNHNMLPASFVQQAGGAGTRSAHLLTAH